MWYKIAEKLSVLQILLNRRGDGKTWILINGIKNKKEEVFVLVGRVEESKWIRDEYNLGNNVKFVSYNGNIEKLRGIRSPILVEHTALSNILSDAFRMNKELREENEILKSDIRELKSHIEEVKHEQRHEEDSSTRKTQGKSAYCGKLSW